MTEELIQEFDETLARLRDFAKRYKETREEGEKLQSLVAAIQADQKKALRLINEYEKMEKDREKVKEKTSQLLEKLERLRI
ncbi:MAG: hypothetical protein HY401_08085 [Elusimicrobia bacterium]|nr:hypothetical protein [Elusimicrobiota bacterium]